MVGYKLAQQVHIAIIQRIDRKIDFRFGSLRAKPSVRVAFVLAVFAVLAGHNLKLLDFAVKRVSLKEGVVLLLLHLLGLQLLVARSHVA